MDAVSVATKYIASDKMQLLRYLIEFTVENEY